MRKIKNVNEVKGITLIALVITIVILIILASVAITMSLSNNGLFPRVKQAREDYQTSINEEELGVAKLANEIEKNVNGSRDTVVLTQEQYNNLLKKNEYRPGDKVELVKNLENEQLEMGYLGHSNWGGSAGSIYIPLPKEISETVEDVSIDFEISNADCNGTRYQASNFEFYDINIINSHTLLWEYNCKSKISSMQTLAMYFTKLQVSFN